MNWLDGDDPGQLPQSSDVDHDRQGVVRLKPDAELGRRVIEGAESEMLYQQATDKGYSNLRRTSVTVVLSVSAICDQL